MGAVSATRFSVVPILLLASPLKGEERIVEQL
jgi:hypothetical protein